MDRQESFLKCSYMSWGTTQGMVRGGWYGTWRLVWYVAAGMEPGVVEITGSQESWFL